MAEPPALTGINDIDEEISHDNINELVTFIKSEKLDNEFKAMLLHYYAILSWPFDRLYIFPELIALIQANRKPYKFALPFKNRGQMGEYWNSIHQFTI